mmetsp:Transcript_5018/g.6462  ORF Transcript_5018/g.6462 Transcript_5018/m.6462 type:complete len:83 (-) Transcript_5018:126-374(-)
MMRLMTMLAVATKGVLALAVAFVVVLRKKIGKKKELRRSTSIELQVQHHGGTSSDNNEPLVNNRPSFDIENASTPVPAASSS